MPDVAIAQAPTVLAAALFEHGLAELRGDSSAELGDDVIDRQNAASQNRSTRQSERRALLWLHDAQAILERINELGDAYETEVGYAVHRLQSGCVVLLNLDATGAQVGKFSVEVANQPGSLRLLVRRAGRALAEG